jgi:hypothetical protein
MTKPVLRYSEEPDLFGRLAWKCRSVGVWECRSVGPILRHLHTPPPHPHTPTPPAQIRLGLETINIPKTAP